MTSDPLNIPFIPINRVPRRPTVTPYYGRRRRPTPRSLSNVSTVLRFPVGRTVYCSLPPSLSSPPRSEEICWSTGHLSNGTLPLVR